jgi:phage terminase large subunit-like protein
MPLFGWKRADGTRRFRIAYIEIPKKNGKSAIGSGLSLYLLAADNEPGAEVYSAAADRDQASIVFNEAARMVDSSPVLAKRLGVVQSRKTITFLAEGSVYRALSADVPTKEGLNIHALIFDELHAQKSRDLWDTLRYGGAARRQPLIVSITTAGFDRHSICWEQRDYAIKVRDAIIEDDSYFTYIRAAEPEDDWTAPETWYKANPSMGITIDEREFSQACKEAQESPVKENSFKRYRLNIWTEQSVRWLQMDKWDACNALVDPARFKGNVCYAGLDLASTTDIAALSLIFRDGDGFVVLPYFWIPEENARRRERKDRVPYMTWARHGLIDTTPGNVIDFDRIRKRINELNDMFNIKEIAIDRWNASQLTTQLDGDGFTMVPFGQGFASMSSPTKELEAIVLSKRLAHGGNAVLRWMASNIAVKEDAAGNIKPDKEKSSEKIDGMVALIMALDRASRHGIKKSVYEERGIRVL